MLDDYRQTLTIKFLYKIYMAEVESVVIIVFSTVPESICGFYAIDQVYGVLLHCNFKRLANNVNRTAIYVGGDIGSVKCG